MKFYCKEDQIQCPFCQHQLSEDDSNETFWHGYHADTTSSDHSEDITRQIECSNCSKIFVASIDRHNVDRGYSSYPENCEKLKKKHKFKFEKYTEFTSGTGSIRQKMSTCSVCDKSKFEAIDKNNKKLSALEEAQIRRNFQKYSVIVDKNSKEFELTSYFSDYFKELSIRFSSETEEGNNQVCNDILEVLVNLGFSVDKPKKDQFLNYMNLDPKGSKGIFAYDIDVYPKGGEVKIKTPRDSDLSYLDLKYFKLLERKIVSKLILTYQGARLKVKSKQTWHGKPELDYFDKEEDKIKHLRTFKVIKEETSPYNVKDKDGLMLKDGDTRYFYQKGRLVRAEVYHNINNMWWAITGGQIRNLACFELFSKTENTPLYEPIDRESRLQVEIKKELQKENYQRCADIQKVIVKIKKGLL